MIGRGTSLFNSDALQRIYNEMIVPEIDNNHHLIGVGTVTEQGIKAAIVYHRPVTVMGIRGEWRIEGAFFYDWSSERDVEGKILFKL